MAGKNWRRVGPNLYVDRSGLNYYSLGEGHFLYEGAEPVEQDRVAFSSQEVGEDPRVARLFDELALVLVSAGELEEKVLTLNQRVRVLESALAYAAPVTWRLYKDRLSRG